MGGEATNISYFVTVNPILHAHRCAVLDFQIGDNVTAKEVEAVSYKF